MSDKCSGWADRKGLYYVSNIRLINGLHVIRIAQYGLWCKWDGWSPQSLKPKKKTFIKIDQMKIGPIITFRRILLIFSVLHFLQFRSYNNFNSYWSFGFPLIWSSGFGLRTQLESDRNKLPLNQIIQILPKNYLSTL